MKKFKKILLSVLSLALVAVLSIAGTLAYLKSEDSDVNVMTMGNVKIDQLEFERVVENDAWVTTGESDKYGYTPDKVQEFTQDKPLYPAVFADGNIKWDDRVGTNGDNHQQSWGQVEAPGSNQLFDDSVKNVIDKFVFVKNTGKSDAYVRTWIALEQGSVAAEEFKNVIMTNTNANHWSWEAIATDVEIDGNEYYVILATYLGPKSNPTGILAPGATSYASLLQVYMRPEATNEDVEAIDGNNNGKYDILVMSQAVQTKGFENAETALSEAFGEEHPWVNYDFSNSVVTEEDLDNKLSSENQKAVLDSDIVIEEHLFISAGNNAVLNLNNHKITFLGDNACISPGFNATLTIEGNGYINGNPSNLFGIGGTFIIKGGTYNFNPATNTNWGWMSTGIVADGYKVVDNGNGTWTVKPE